MLKGYPERGLVGGTTLDGMSCTLYQVPNAPFLKRLFFFVTHWATPTHVKAQVLFRGLGLRGLKEDIETWADSPHKVLSALDEILKGLTEGERESLNQV